MRCLPRRRTSFSQMFIGTHLLRTCQPPDKYLSGYTQHRALLTMGACRTFSPATFPTRPTILFSPMRIERSERMTLHIGLRQQSLYFPAPFRIWIPRCGVVTFGSIVQITDRKSVCRGRG